MDASGRIGTQAGEADRGRAGEADRGRAGEADRGRAGDVDRVARGADGGRWDSSGSDRGFPSAGRPESQGSYWHGLAGGGAAGKGPVRGYPPMPGQPPPMYPPGQFAAWNRGQPGDAGRAAPAQPASRQPVQSGPHSGWQPRQPGSRPDGTLGPGGPLRAGGGVGHGAGQGAGPDGGAARYDDQDTGQGAEPSYPMLAVSDPAADVTSTQTWRAVEDGRTTGIWTAPATPATPGGDTARRPGRHGSGAHSGPDAGTSPARGPGATDPGSLPGRQQPQGELPSARLSPVAGPAADVPASGWSPGAPRPTPTRQPDSERSDPGGRRADGVPAADRGRRGARGQHSGVRTAAAAGAAAAGAGAASQTTARPDTTRPESTSPRTGVPGTGGPGTGGPGTGRPGTGRRSGSKRRAKRPASVKLAITVALLLVLVAAGTLAYTVLRTLHGHGTVAGNKPKVTATTPATTPSASSSPTPGPYGLIASRKADPVPLTVAQLFPNSFTAGGSKVTLVASRIGSNCSNAVAGSKLQAKVSVDGCSQAVRATYVDSGRGLMGTIGVLNISTAVGAAKAAKIADGSDFVAQVTTRHGPAHRIGQGTGIEEAAAKGHYLILIWAEFTSRKKPKTTAQRNQVEAFMTDLLKQTANVSLTNRMLTGHP